MKISPIEEYGLRCLLTLARNRDKPWSIEAIAQREGLTKAYVAKIVMLLRRSGLVECSRGRTGGIRLARDPSEITVAHALGALDGPLYRATACHDFTQGDSCELSFCSIRGFWGEIADTVNRMLENTTIQDFLIGERFLGSCSKELFPGFPAQKEHQDTIPTKQSHSEEESACQPRTNPSSNSQTRNTSGGSSPTSSKKPSQRVSTRRS